ncbi:MAG: hypothetical protein AAFY31_03150, partial [Pseudomonadota bacterium]
YVATAVLVATSLHALVFLGPIVILFGRHLYGPPAVEAATYILPHMLAYAVALSLTHMFITNGRAAKKDLS